MGYKLVITYLYPQVMSTYGDRGNMLALKKRAEWRGIDVEVRYSDVGEPIEESDLYFFGGGQDQEQQLVSRDLLGRKAEFLRREAENFKPMLLICGGYQLMGRYYQTASGERIEGAGVLDLYTEAGPKRMIGDVVLVLEQELGIEGSWAGQRIRTLVGFENHSGRTYLGGGLKPIGRVIRGHGNNGEDGREGAVYKNVYGCYQHGPILPKNPHFADHLLRKALEVRYQKSVNLRPLDDSLEWKAHAEMVKRQLGRWPVAA